MLGPGRQRERVVLEATRPDVMAKATPQSGLSPGTPHPVELGKMKQNRQRRQAGIAREGGGSREGALRSYEGQASEAAEEVRLEKGL